MTETVVDIRNLRFSWPDQPPLLAIERFSIKPRQRLFLQGASGSGKSTLLGLIAGVLVAQAGQINVMGQDLKRLSNSGRDRLRADQLGVIFQMFNLVPYLSVAQNVALPCRFSPHRRQIVNEAGGVESEIRRLLAALGLDGSDILQRKVTELSVGQQQRVAAARALIGQPSLIIADEPTSALDANTRDRFIDLLSTQVQSSGASLLFVSHDGALARLFDDAIDLGELNQMASSADTSK